MTYQQGQQVQVVDWAAMPYVNGRTHYDPSTPGTGRVTAVFPGTDGDGSPVTCHSVLLDPPNRGEVIIWDAARHLRPYPPTPPPAPGRCLHQSGTFQVTRQVVREYGVDGRLLSSSDQPGRWTYTCLDCGKSWRMAVLGQTRLKWLRVLSEALKKECDV